MPVIRGESKKSILTEPLRKELLEQLRNELSGKRAGGGPLIFEIPLEQTDRIDVLVVWDAFEDLRSEERAKLILDSYGDDALRIAQILGVTYQEALDEHLLPYVVRPQARQGRAVAADIRQAMLDEGGIALPGGKVDLRFPTAAMAEAAHARLYKRLPKSSWSIAQTAKPPD
jgi:hypothetical protein